MTGRCYYCTAGDHGDCQSLHCTCCGEKNRRHREIVEQYYQALKQALTQKGDEQ